MTKGTDSSRRGFVKKAFAGIGIASLPGGQKWLGASEKASNEINKLPREIWVASITSEGFQPQTYQENIELLLERMEEVVPFHPDLVCLTEVAPFMRLTKRPPFEEIAEEKMGPITSRFAAFAKKHHCCVIIPLYTKEKGRYYNASVLIDREGNYAGEYRKIYLTVGEMNKGLTPGPTDPPVFKTDFGVIGMQICFDMQFFDGFKRLGEKGAEIVFWPSAYCAGKAVNTVAWMNPFPIVSCSRDDPAKICDIAGRDVAKSSFRYKHWLCEPINLEKTIVKRWPHQKKLEAITKKYGRKVNIEILDEEGWAIIESLSAEIQVNDLLKEFEIERFRKQNELAEKMYKTNRIHP